MSVTFETNIIREGNHASIEIPDAVLTELGTNKRAPLIVTINGHSYRSTATGVGGACRVVFPQAERAAAGVSTGAITVHLELDSGVREVDVPPDLAKALTAADLRDAFDARSYSHRREWARSVTDAKKPDTRSRRIDAVLKTLRGDGSHR